MTRCRIVASAFSAVGLAVLAFAAPAAATVSSAPLPVPYNALDGYVAQAVTPNASPPGANDWSCRPSAAHPRPVVLVHGFLSNQTVQWQTVAPLLHNEGYCVFSLTYGTYAPADPTGQQGGLDYVQNDSKQVAAFVDRVRAATGTAQVDLVGTSAGGWVGRWYIQFDGGATTVHTYVGLAPANGPTNLSQLAFAFARLSPASAQFVDGFSAAVQKVVPLMGQAIDRQMYARLNAGGGTSDSVDYTNIASNYDELVPPSSAFVPYGAHVHNIVLQDGCPIDTSDHIAMASGRRVLGFMLNALDPATARTPPCVPVVPLVGSL